MKIQRLVATSSSSPPLMRIISAVIAGTLGEDRYDYEYIWIVAYHQSGEHIGESLIADTADTGDFSIAIPDVAFGSETYLYLATVG